MADDLNLNLDGTTVSINGASTDVAPAFKAVVQHYVGDGAAKLLELGDQAEEYGKKIIAVAEDASSGASLGAGIGSVIPILGTAAGGVIGSYIGGVYGAFDEFGGDVLKIIHNVLNPDDFTPGDYDRMRKRGILSGGLPNPGWPPDNEMGTIYPDGKTSGGEWPRHPGPGVQSVRGDTPYPVAIPAGMVPGPDGYPIPQFKLSLPPSAQVKPSFRIPKTLGEISFKPPAAAPAPAPLPKGVKPPPPPTAKDVAKSLGKNLLQSAHLTVLAAKSGDTTAKAGIASVVDAAEKTGAPGPVQTAQALSLATKILNRAPYVQFWLYGEGAARVAGKSA